MLAGAVKLPPPLPTAILSFEPPVVDKSNRSSPPLTVRPATVNVPAWPSSSVAPGAILVVPLLVPLLRVTLPTLPLPANVPLLMTMLPVLRVVPVTATVPDTVVAAIVVSPA